MDFKTIEYKDEQDLIKQLKTITKSFSESLIKLLLELIKQHGTSEAHLEKNLKWTADTLKNIKNVFTKDSYFTTLRKAFKEHHPTKDEAIKNGLRLTDKERGEKVSRQQRKLTENLKEIDIYDPLAIYKLMDDLNKSNKLTDLIILLQLATGRRLIEVLRITSTPPEVKGRPGYILIDKMAKTQASKINNIEVPLIHISYADMRKAWETVRGGLTDEDKKKTNQALTNTYNARVARRMRAIFDDDSATSHRARKIYGALSYREYAPDNIDRSLYLNKVLGHTEASLDGRNYANVKVRTKAPEAKIKDTPKTKETAPEAKINITQSKDIIEAMSIIKAMRDKKINISNRKIREYARVGSVKAKFINDIAKGKTPDEAGKMKPRKTKPE